MNWFMAILLKWVKRTYEAVVALGNSRDDEFKEINTKLDEILSRLPPLVVDVTLEGSVDLPIKQ